MRWISAAEGIISVRQCDAVQAFCKDSLESLCHAAADDLGELGVVVLLLTAYGALIAKAVAKTKTFAETSGELTGFIRLKPKAGDGISDALWLPEIFNREGSDQAIGYTEWASPVSCTVRSLVIVHLRRKFGLSLVSAAL